MDIKLVLQPPGVQCCGQACCAMLTGMELEDVCREIGHSHASYTREIVKFLRSHGYDCPDKLRRLKTGEPLPDPCIIKMRIGDRTVGHVVVYHDGVCYDPSLGKQLPSGYAKFNEHGKVRLTSYLPLTKKEAKSNV